MATALVTVPTVIFKPPPRKIRPFLSQFKSNPQFSFPQIKNPNPIKFSPKSTLKPVTDQAPTTVLREYIAGSLETLKKRGSFVILLGFLSTSDPCSAIAASGGRSSLNSFRQLYSYSYHRHIASGVLLCVGIVAAIVLWRTWILKMMSWIVSATQSSVSSSSSPVPSSSVSMVEAGLISAGTVAVIFICYLIKNRSDRAQRSTVLKLQVGLLDMGRSLQKVLNRIAKTVSKPSSEELSYVLTETLLALLRHPDCCSSSYSSVDVKQSIEDGENLFNQHTIVERGKFDKETLVNVNGIKHRRASTQRISNFGLSGNRYIVVTILVAIKGEHNLPVINKIDDLKSAIHTLGSLPANKTLAVEVLWTPQNKYDTLSEQELLRDYPLLKPL